MSNPNEVHLAAAKRVLRYVKGTLNYGIHYGRNDDQKLKVYTDSNYARDVEERRSTSGNVYMVNGGTICWSSLKQEIVTLSTTEAEYVAATKCVCHCVWLKGLMEELGEKVMEPVEIICDNSSTIKLSKNPVMHRRTKHIDVRFHYLRELANQEIIKLVFCRSDEQLAYIMTKPLKLESHEKLRSEMGFTEVVKENEA